jgi:hypothetical protein
VRFEEIRQGIAVKAGNADDCLQPADAQQQQREQNPGLELRNFEAIIKGVEDGLKHGKPGKQTATNLDPKSEMPNPKQSGNSKA